MNDLYFHVPTRIFVGKNKLMPLAGIISEQMTRVMLVTDTLLADVPTVENIQSALKKKGVDCLLFSEIGTTSTSETMYEAIDIIRKGSINGIIGFGGIRCLTYARVIALLSAYYPAKVGDLIDEPVKFKRGFPYFEVVASGRNPWMLTNSFFLRDERTGNIEQITVPGSFPEIAVFSEELTRTLSSKMATLILMDILLTSIEGFFSTKSTFLSETIFLRCIGRAISAIDTYDEDTLTQEFHEKLVQAGVLLSFGYTMSLPGFATYLTYSICESYKVPKSWVASILVPYLLEYGLDAAPDKVARIAPILERNIKGLTIYETANKVVDNMRQEISSLEIPLKLKGISMDQQERSKLAREVISFNGVSYMPVHIQENRILAILNEII